MLRLSQEVAGRPNPQIRYRRDGVDGASFMHLTEEEEDQGFVMRTIARYGPNLGGVSATGTYPLRTGSSKTWVQSGKRN
jgi:hypothetical protein